FLDRALIVDKDFDEAMSYTNLLYREKAALAAEVATKENLIAQADQWFEKAIATRKQNQQARQTRIGSTPTPPPPPPPPRDASSLPPGTMRMSPQVMESNLVLKPALVYPELAQQSRIQGSVVLEVLINKDGRVEQTTVLSGHPLLVQAA